MAQGLSNVSRWKIKMPNSEKMEDLQISAFVECFLNVYKFRTSYDKILLAYKSAEKWEFFIVSHQDQTVFFGEKENSKTV